MDDSRYFNCRKNLQGDRTGRLKKHYEVKKEFKKNVIASIFKTEIESITDQLTKCHRCIYLLLRGQN